MTEDLTPAELRAITGKTRASAQAAALARKGIAFVFTGHRVRVARVVALAYELVPSQQGRGVDFSKVR